ncbi:hypothetical protein PG993_003129 [Apiospora rasikravindrae]|uniref:Terpene synthase n=1 Tax=Apiospora rasikravindrae TaxID=990691 RepID=A0ABR1TYN0_9PEZI
MPKHTLGSHDYVQTLEGQKLRFPDFDGLVQGWPRGINPNFEAVKEGHEDRLERLLGPGKRLDILVHATKPALLAATFWPTSSFDALMFAADLAAWMYIWDDELDSPELSNLHRDWDGGERLRHKTVEYLDAALSPETQGGEEYLVSTDALPVTLASFAAVAKVATSQMAPGPRQLLLRELVRSVEASGAEQLSELSGLAPSLDEYMEIRLRTCAVVPISATIEFMNNVDLGDELRAHPCVQRIHAEINCVIALTNDVFSLKRELKYPFYNNVIAVLYHQYHDLQIAVDKTYVMVKCSIARLLAAEARLLELFPGRQEEVAAFVGGAKTMITGNITWSIQNARYGLGISKCDGTTEIVI